MSCFEFCPTGETPDSFTLTLCMCEKKLASLCVVFQQVSVMWCGVVARTRGKCAGMSTRCKFSRGAFLTAPRVDIRCLRWSRAGLHLCQPRMCWVGTKIRTKTSQATNAAADSFGGGEKKKGAEGGQLEGGPKCKATWKGVRIWPLGQILTLVPGPRGPDLGCSGPLRLAPAI